jgi:uncharacterized iron-regulated membrane protein
MRPRALRVWSWLHTWSSLVCTAFMLLLCLTGLPLIFEHEIEHLTGSERELPQVAPGTVHIGVDRILAIARAEWPDRVVQFAMPHEESDWLWFVTMTPTPAPTEDWQQVVVDARDGRVLGRERPAGGVMAVVERLHVDLFAGPPGKLFLGAMGLLMLVAIVSGVVLYAPFMRKLRFGEVRHQRAARIRWLDLHNLLGIATVAWLVVVGATGVIHTVDDQIVKLWRAGQLREVLAPYGGEAVVPLAERASVQRSMDAALAQVPGSRVSFIAFPGTSFSSPHHHTFFLQGATPLTSQLRQPVLVDARTAQVTAAPPLPWYFTLLQLARPLHYGDYAGLPLKVLWALLDIGAIVVLGSGIFLWLRKRRAQAQTQAPAPLFDEALR